MKTNNIESVFLTVGTKKQKQLCEKLVSDFKDKYNLNIFVIADDEQSTRIGSGGAMLNILGASYNSGNKILIINSGGFSKRSVNYAIRGKAFVNVEYNGKVVSLFELLIINAKRLFDSFSSGVVVCCSDILVDTSNVKTEFDNNIGFCVRADYETGSRHGVMFCNTENVLAEYPHKCDAQKLRKMSAVYNEDGVLIDTGLLYFKDEVCLALKNAVNKQKIIKKLILNKVEINLYSEIVALFAEKIDKNAYLYDDAQNDCHVEIKKLLFDLLSEYTLKVCVLEEQKFIHFGSLAESLENILMLSAKKDGRLQLYSYADELSVIGKNTVLDNVVLKNGCTVGAGCIVSDITLDGVGIKDKQAVCGVKLCDGNYVAIVCDINENPKTKINSEELWDVPRFFKGKSFTESFNKFIADAAEKKYSLRFCMENADFDYFCSRMQYLKDRESYIVNRKYHEIREQIINHYFENRENITHICYKTEKVELSFPVRVNFSGTWTDAMPYCIDNGGQVVNMAVTVDGKNPIIVIAEKLSYKKIEFCSDDVITEFSFDDFNNEDDLSDFNLHTAVLKTLGITEETAYDCGFRLTTKVSSIDKGSGLGTSSILLGGCIKALGELFGKEYSDNEIINMVFVAEQLMKTGGGWQDQIGGLLPSIKIATTAPGIYQTPDIQYVALSDCFRKFFSERLVLIPTGQRHFGRFIVNDVVNRYLCENEESVSSHIAIKELNTQILSSIKDDDFENFMLCLNKHFGLLKKISPMVSNEKIEKLIRCCLENVADAVSICGAGGGGYLLAVMKEGITLYALQEYIKSEFPSIASPVRKIDVFE